MMNANVIRVAPRPVAFELSLAPLFVATAFTSSALLFALEPMFGKMLLPTFGGEPAVWNTTLVFYQLALLAGYGYAHILRTRLPLRGQLGVHCTLAFMASLVLPIHAPLAIGDLSKWPVGGVLLETLIGVGFPFFVLAANTTLIATWFAQQARGKTSAYLLYAASNLGSLLALAAYPLLLEPRFGLTQQTRVWSSGYFLFTILLAGCALGLARGRNAAPPVIQPADSARAGNRQILRWMLFAAVPSSLLLGTTTYLADQVASLPLLWTLPLGLYLATFVIAFGFPIRALRAVAGAAVPIALAALTFTMLGGEYMRVEFVITLHLTTFFLIALFCHATLSLERPAESRLSEFYLWLAAGGALGGMFNALLAPVAFTSVVEYPVALAVAARLIPTRTPDGPGRSGLFGDFFWSLALAGMVAYLGLWPQTVASRASIFAFVALGLLAFGRRPRRLAYAFGLVFAVYGAIPMLRGHEPIAKRNFFGVKYVESTVNLHELYHGSTLHGAELTIPGKTTEPLTYYSRNGPLGDIFRALEPRLHGRAAIGVVGLGTGTIASYAKPSQDWTFYEIDPQVVEIATDPRYFRYLSDGAPHARIELGDARLRLAQDARGDRALLILDAYSSDQIPVHLLTREALLVYLRVLAPHGVLAFHISNRYFDLAPVLRNLADDAGLVARIRTDGTMYSASFIQRSTWVVMAHDATDLGALQNDRRWTFVPWRAGLRLWTDDYSSLITAWAK
jgi:SAM-dependent methyltransferase